MHLGSSAGDEEPLVNGWVNWCWSKALVLWDRWELLWGDASRGVLDIQVGAIKCYYWLLSN